MNDSLSGGNSAAAETPTSTGSFDDSVQILSTSDDIENAAPPAEKPEPQVEEPDDDGEEADGEQKEPVQKKTRKGFLKKLDRAEGERDTYKAEVERLRAKYEAQTEAAKPAETKSADSVEPNPADFETYGDYINAVRQFDRQVADKAAEEKVQKALSERDGKKAQAEFEAHVASRGDAIDAEIKAKEESNPGLFERLEKAIDEGAFTQPLALMITQIDNSADVTEYLVDNPAKLEELAAITDPARLQQAMFRLQGFVEGTKKAPDAPKRQTKASDPIAPVNTSKANSNYIPKDVNEMSQSEWDAKVKALRNKP